mmetsp:Transcript_42852/g.87622  ORF Transcript_42852/g.87622 Transcript_42852/m.87622 type:complete len:216 (+) Transcript_42852:108-755(+)
MEISFLKTFPPVTRLYLSISIIANFLVFFNLMNPTQIFLNYQLIFSHFDFWRLFSHAFFFGPVGVKTIFYIFFFSRYSKALESFSFQGRCPDYLYLLFTGNSILVLLKLFVPEASFLGPALTFMIVYLWGKKNAQQQINLINMFHIRGSSLPLVLMIASWFLRQKTLKFDIMGIMAGHIYYYLEEIYPRLTGGQKLLSTPRIFKDFLVTCEIIES